MGANWAYALVAVLLVYLGTVHSLYCYQCNSTNSSVPFQCTEVLSGDIDIVPESCDAVFGAQYCVKHTGRFEGGIGTKRFCSSQDLGNFCDYVKHSGDKLTYRSCIFTCSGDGCNPAATMKPGVATWILPIIAFLIISILLQR